METLFLIGQIILGAYFVFSGLMHFVRLKDMSGYAQMKGLPMPREMTAISGLMLLFGGLGILFQYQLVWAYGVLILFLVTAAFTMHAFWKEKDQMAMTDMVNFQKNLALASALLMLLALS